MTKRPSLAGNVLANSMKALAEDTSPNPEALAAGRSREAEKKGSAPSRLGMKKLLTPIEPSLHTRLKIMAAKRETTLEALTRAALNEYLARHDDQAS